MDDDKILATFNAYDQEGIDLYSHALNYLCALNDIKEYIRGLDKYGNGSDEVQEKISKIREDMYDMLARYHLPEDV